MANLPDVTVRLKAELADEFSARVFAALAPEVFAPCRLSREGGMCGCGEDDDADTRLTVRLPAYMAGPSGQRIATVGRKWAEVFPGLQASLSSCGGLNDDAKAIILFRLTPSDRQDRD